MAKRDKNTAIGDEQQRPIPSKKNKKKWCRGKVNVPHKPKPMEATFWWSSLQLPQWWDLVCTNCGKRLDSYYPMRWKTKEPPGWVPEE